MAITLQRRRAAGTYQLPRDGATDRGNLRDLQTVGLAGYDPNTGQLVAAPQAIGENLGGLQEGYVPQFTAVGRPALQHDPGFTAVTLPNPSVDSGPGPVLAGGTIRRNIAWPLVGGGGLGEFSSTANDRPGGAGRAFQPTPVEEYVISSVHLQLDLPLSWPVAGVKPLIGQGPDATHRHRMLSRASGVPVVAAQVPSFASRVPMVRPTGLVSVT